MYSAGSRIRLKTCSVELPRACLAERSHVIQHRLPEGARRATSVKVALPLGAAWSQVSGPYTYHGHSLAESGSGNKQLEFACAHVLSVLLP